MVSRISPVITCRNRRLISRLRAADCARRSDRPALLQNVTSATAPSRAYLELMAEALGLALANQRLRSALLEKALFDSPACVTAIIWMMRCIRK
jgi:hypothetical protein